MTLRSSNTNYANKKEFIQLIDYNDSHMKASWNVHEWRYRFATMYLSGNSDCVNTFVRVIGWQDNCHTNEKNAKYLDLLIKEEQLDCLIPYAEDLDAYLIEIGCGKEDTFFPFLQSEPLKFAEERKVNNFCYSLSDWIPCLINDRKWFDQFSTYTYYETMGGK